MEITPGVEEVHRRLLDRILTGFYPGGSKLPSCRALAEELGSNSSTVDRAIGRLASAGRVRTVHRRGTFVHQGDAVPVDASAVVGADLDDILLRARRLGFSAVELKQMVAEALGRVDSMRRIALVECNERDLRTLQKLVQDATGVEVQPILLGDVGDRVLDEEFDAVACPIFHLNDVAAHVRSLDQVVELNLVASPSALRRLIELRDYPALTVVAPSARGLQWMTALVGQYFPGQIDGVDSSLHGEEVLEGRAIVVVNNAAQLSLGFEEKVEHIVAIEWELDARFAPALRARIEQTVGTSSSVQE